MAKIKFTKGELKLQRDSLRQYERYLPVLQLKKQQLQAELLRQHVILEERQRNEAARIKSIQAWAGLLAEGIFDLRPFLVPAQTVVARSNIAGVDLPVFERAEFSLAEYDLFVVPLWVDSAIESLRALVSLRREIEIIKKGIEILKQELRVTTQRVNLFEKVKIPQAEEAIRLIKIYIGDQMVNAVGRSKIAKNKIETAMLQEAGAVV